STPWLKIPPRRPPEPTQRTLAPDTLITMTEDRRDEIDEVLSKYLPPKPASSDGHQPQQSPADDHHVAADDTDSEQLTDGLFASIKSNLLFIVPALLLAWSLITVVFG